VAVFPPVLSLSTTFPTAAAAVEDDSSRGDIDAPEVVFDDDADDDVGIKDDGNCNCNIFVRRSKARLPFEAVSTWCVRIVNKYVKRINKYVRRRRSKYVKITRYLLVSSS
jgi:hypothetical protein